MTDKIIVYGGNMESGYKIQGALFVSLRPLYVTVMRYLEECPGSGRVIVSSVVNKYIDKIRVRVSHLLMNSCLTGLKIQQKESQSLHC